MHFVSFILPQSVAPAPLIIRFLHGQMLPTAAIGSERQGAWPMAASPSPRPRCPDGFSISYRRFSYGTILPSRISAAKAGIRVKFHAAFRISRTISAV